MCRNMQQVQDGIVDFSERLHKLGLRHSGLSGQLCEQLLKRELVKDTHLQYTTGQIILDNGKSSPQIDLIMHQTRIENAICSISKDINVVPLHDVVGVVEVKKWTFPKMAASIAESMAAIQKSIGWDIPLFHVSIRHKDRHSFQNWESFREGLTGIHCFCFYGAYHSKNGKAIYPFEETERGLSYNGQYEALVRSIEERCAS